jgi:hypothetical protein
MLDVTMFALLIVGAVGVCLRQANRLGKVGKIGFRLTLTGSVISAIVGSTIIVVGYAVSDEATLEILDAITHPLARLPYAGGSLIFGMPTFRAGILPREGAFMVAVGPIWPLALFMTGFGGQASAAIPTSSLVASGVAAGRGCRKSELEACLFEVEVSLDAASYPVADGSFGPLAGAA